MGTALATRTFAMFGDSRYEFPSGFTFPAAFGLLAHLYAYRYGIPLERLKEQMAAVSVQSHEYAMKNPNAQIQKKLTKEEVLNSFMVTTPIQLHNACPFSDGAAAVVLAGRGSQEAYRSAGIYLRNWADFSQAEFPIPVFTPAESLGVGCRAAYRIAGLTPKDIDVCELHDCFSSTAIIAAEGLGLFEFGTAGEAWER